MTIYELISLQIPFEKLYKINPDVNINTYVIKKWRPPLPLKASSLFLNVHTLLHVHRVFGLHALLKKL